MFSLDEEQSEQQVCELCFTILPHGLLSDLLLVNTVCLSGGVRRQTRLACATIHRMIDVGRGTALLHTVLISFWQRPEGGRLYYSLTHV